MRMRSSTIHPASAAVVMMKVFLLLPVLVPLLQLLLHPTHFCSCLSTTPFQSSSTSGSGSSAIPHRPIQRIAIIGAGISGLAVTHALIHSNVVPTTTAADTTTTMTTTNPPIIIDLFDARKEFDHTAGAGIQLNGGLSILRRINPTLQQAVYQAGISQTQIQSRANPWWRWWWNNNNNNNNKLDYDILLQLDFKNVVQSAGGKIAEALLQSFPTNNTTMHNHNTSNTSSLPEEESPPPLSLLWISIMRGALQRVLYETLPPPSSTNRNCQWRLQFQKKLIHIRSSSSSSSASSLSSSNDNDGDHGTVVYCQFDDGTESGPYDVIIGCEGINSYVKQYIQCTKQGKQIAVPISTTTTTAAATTTTTTPSDSRTSLNTQSAFYSGLRIRYAVADDTDTDTPSPTSKLTQFFGNGAYALHGTYGAGRNQPNTQCAFIVYLDENYIGPFRRKKPEPSSPTSTTTAMTAPPTIGENADWTQDQRRTVQMARENMLQQLQDCQIPGDDSDILRQTIRKADRFFELGSYYHNPFGSWSCTVTSSSSSSSSSNHNPAHVVLCGDAAHALPPFLGQGSNQAIQDAYCLVTKMEEYNTRIANGDIHVTLQSLLNEYERARWLPCFEIFWKAAFLGYLETGGINGFYSKFRDAFFKSMGIIGVASKVLLNAATPKV